MKTVLWGTGSIFLSVGTLALGLAGGMVAGWVLFTAEVPPPPECPPQVECPEAQLEPCDCDAPEEPEEPGADEVAADSRPSATTGPSARPAPEPSAQPSAKPSAKPSARPELAGTARVVVQGDVPRELWFEQGGRVVGSGPLGPGTYHLVAALGTAAPRVMGEVVVAEGQETLTINCSERWGKCRAIDASR